MGTRPLNNKNLRLKLTRQRAVLYRKESPFDMPVMLLFQKLSYPKIKFYASLTGRDGIDLVVGRRFALIYKLSFE